MKITLKRIVIAGLILFPLTAHAVTFSDVYETSRYAAAINYLSEVGVINGYPDGTFKPDNPVNRVEFLKLVLESSDVASDVETPANFPDVDNTQWYAKYVRKAWSEGWIEGYPDGTFKPEQQINKVEALKIIGEVQQWDLPATVTEAPFNDTPVTEWYTPYIAYAKSKNFLEETTSNYIPETLFSRAKISELLFRSFIVRKSGEDVYSFSLVKKYPASLYAGDTADTVPSDEPVDVNFTPYSYKTYNTDFFDNVTLDSKFPNIFYQNEVYYFKGSINDGDYDHAFVFLSQNGNQSTNFPVALEGGDFIIPVIFRTAGNYQLGLIPGTSGESKVADISVMPSLPEPLSEIQGTRAPKSLKAEYKNQATTFSWDSNDYELIRITIYQGTKTKQFLFRQGLEEFSIDYTDFENFDKTTTYYVAEGCDLETEMPLSIKNPWSNPSGINFKADLHQYSYHEEDKINVNSLPETMDKTGTISFTGTVNTDTLTQAAIIKPDGFVDLIDITSTSPKYDYYGSSYLKADSNFTFSYNAEVAGTYILEINGTDGSAILNTPVYVNNGIPLVPNYFDLYENNHVLTSIDISAEITKQLNLINQERQKFGLGTVVIDASLNNLAQLHTEDMITRSFFGHVNPDGQTPNDRRVALGIETPVGENLAIAPNSEYTIYGLMQSGVHRKNILDPTWTKVGIGIALDSNNNMLTTQEFSSESLTEDNLQSIKNNILTAVNNKRASEWLEVFTIDGSLETPADIWSLKMAEDNFFDFTAPDGTTLANTVRTYVPTKAIQALILEGSTEAKITEELLKSAEIVNAGWQKIGIGVSVNNVGMLKATILFTTL